MKARALPHDPDLETLPLFASWIALKGNETLEQSAFFSGAALATMHVLLARDTLPQALLRARLALTAAEACVAFSGRSERAGELRDAVHLLRPGEDAGPSGSLFQAWHQASARRLSIEVLHRALPAHMPAEIKDWLAVGQGGPVACAAAVLECVLDQVPYGEEVALILADAALAQAMGWDHLVPLLARSLSRRALSLRGAPLQRACHQSLVTSARDAVQTGRDLARRAARLQAVAPRLRAKAAPQAVAMFLSRDAVSPSVALTGVMSDRAARRLCDRLVALGAVRELTGRDSFRLYGV